MGTPLIKGRDFGTGDLPTTVPVAIVNQVFVDRYLKGRDPIGVQFSAGYPAPDPRNEVTIVGVVDDVRQKSLAEPAEPAFYQPLTQIPAAARDGGRVDVAERTPAPSSEPSAPRCGSSTRRWRSISSSRRTSSAARSGGRSSG